MMTSALSKGLFRRVIGESAAVEIPNVGDPTTLPLSERSGETFATALKIRAGASLKDLRVVSTADIVAAQPDPLTTPPPPYLGVTVHGLELQHGCLKAANNLTLYLLSSRPLSHRPP